jgi:uncharacterized protein (TIGR00255 family)
MIKSMTAFGRARQTVGGKDITVEIRSVNNRFFDCSVKLPRAFSFLEERIKPHLQAAGITRGKIDVFIGIDVVGTPDAAIAVDEGYAGAYIAALRRLRDLYCLPDDISVMTVAQNRDLFIVRKPEEDIERDWADVSAVLDEATEGFISGRVREGKNIEIDLVGKVNAIRERVETIEKLSEADTVTYREKLETRLREMLSDNRIVFDENRILTECAVFADKIAIDEELVRLRSHFDGFEEILRSEEPVGRKLDFLVQEINRETNTIGSKCQNASIAKLVVDIKCEIEKIREQIQNIE